jgi:hypothetical protein
MLQIYVDNNPADTDGVDFTWTRKSPIATAEGKFESDYVYSIDFINNDKNNILFNTPLRFSRVNKKAEFNIRCIHFGSLIFEGVGEVEGANDDTINISVSSGASNFFFDIQDRKVTDEMYDVYNAGSSLVDHAYYVVTGDIDRPYTFPKIYAPDFYGSNNPDFGGDPGTGEVGKYINNWNSASQEFRNNLPVTAPYKRNVYSMMPFFELPYVLDKIFAYFGYKGLGKIFTEADFQKMLIVNNRPLDKVDYKTFKGVYSVENFLILSVETLINFDTIIEDVDNCYTFDGYLIKSPGIYNISVEITYQAYSGFDIDDRVASTVFVKTDAGVYIYNKDRGLTRNTPETVTFQKSFTAYNADVGKKIQLSVLISNGGEGEVFSAQISIQNTSLLKVNSFDPVITASNHLPDMMIGDFLSSIFFAFMQIPFIDDEKKEIELVSFNDIIDSTEYVEFSDNIVNKPSTKANDTTGISIDFSPEGMNEEDFSKINEADFIGYFIDLSAVQNPEAGQIAGRLIDKAYYIYEYNEDLEEMNWVYLTPFAQNYTQGKSTTEISKQFSSLLYQKDIEALYPELKQKANSTFFNITNDCKLQLIIDHGPRTDEYNNTYPSAGMGCYDRYGTKILDQDLSMIGTSGLLETRLQKWINHKINTTPVTMTKLMTSREAKQVQLKKKHRINGIDFIITSMRIPISNRKYSEVEFEMEMV